MEKIENQQFLTKRELFEIQYYYLQYICISDFSNKRQKTCGNVFSSVCPGSKDYFDTMINLHYTMSLIKCVSLMKDESTEFLTADNLDKKVNSSSKRFFANIFDNPNDINNFSNKQIINYIRNALNHNNNNIYHVTRDGKKVSIKMKETKGINKEICPFNVTLDQTDLKFLLQSMEENYLSAPIFDIPNISELSFSNQTLKKDIEKIKIYRYYPPNKQTFELKDYYNLLKQIPKETKFSKIYLDKKRRLVILKKIKQLSSEMKTQDTIEKLKFFSMYLDYLKDSNKYNITLYKEEFNKLNAQISCYNEYFLTEKQKNFLLKALCSFSESNRKQNIKDIIIKLLPIAISKIDDIKQEIEISTPDNNKWESYFSLDKNLKPNKILNFIMFCDFVFCNLINIDEEKNITIDGKTIDLELLRNSFTHGRYYYNFENEENLLSIELNFTDHKNGIKNENIINLQASINLWELYKIACNIGLNFYNAKKEQTIKSK